MSWRTIVITGSAKLDYKMDYLVVRKIDGIFRVHLSEIAVVVIESTAVSVTAMVLCELIKRKVKVIFCDEKHNPISELTACYGSHDTSAKIKAQVEWDSNVKKAVWTEIVTEKIRHQAKHLEEMNYTAEAEMLLQYINEVQFADASNREGHAAKVYFNALFGMEFTRSDDNSVNAALNYGYSILLSYFSREIVANGYITQIGLFHDNMFNQFNLSSDLMEPFRIIIDRAVIKLRPEKFETEEKRNIIAAFNDEVIIDGKRQYVANAIRIYCKSVLDAVCDRDISLIKFYRYEL